MEDEEDFETTAEDFEAFKEECGKWVEYFGLKDWEIVYKHECLENSRAEIHYNINGGRICGRVVTLILSTDWSDNAYCNRDEVKKAAFHEVCELLLINIKTMASYARGEYEVEEEAHKIIRTLENTVFKDACKKEEIERRGVSGGDAGRGKVKADKPKKGRSAGKASKRD